MLETISDACSCKLSPSVLSVWSHNEKYNFNLRSIFDFTAGVASGIKLRQRKHHWTEAFSEVTVSAAQSTTDIYISEVEYFCVKDLSLQHLNIDSALQ